MLTVQSKGAYLLIEIDERVPREEFPSIVDRVPIACRKHNIYRVLLDVSKSSFDFSIMERYDFGIQMARKWGPGIVVAGVAPKKHINHMAETVATNRGGRVMIFDNRKDALKWLGVKGEQ